MGNIVLDHGIVSVEQDVPAQGAHSKYCYMFPELARAEAARGVEKDRASFALVNDLASAMDRVASAFVTARTSSLPAIYTYFGQFLNHDISAPQGGPGFRAVAKQSIDQLPDRGAIEESVIDNDPDLIVLLSEKRAPTSQMIIDHLINRHPAPMQLDSLYGDGPSQQPATGKPIYAADKLKFSLAQVSHVDTLSQSERDKFAARGALPFDHQRDTSHGITYIADRRNDENLILSQLHLALMLFHNSVIDALRPGIGNPAALFETAQTHVRWHYQWCIVHDYLPRIMKNAPAKSKGLLKTLGQVPLEFTSAAFRFGHSMVSREYNYNEVFSIDGSQGPANLSQLFRFTSLGRMGTDPEGVPRQSPTEQLPESWVIDWRRFVSSGPQATAADRVDPVLSAEMSSLPGKIPPLKAGAGLGAIAYRNLRRGYHRFIASGQDLSDAVGIPRLTPSDLQTFFGPAGDYRPAISGLALAHLESDSELLTRTPAWFYFLCEARLRSDGHAVGPTAGAIIAETILGLLEADPRSVLHAADGAWTPASSPLRLKDGAPIESIADMLKFAGVLIA